MTAAPMKTDSDELELSGDLFGVSSSWRGRDSSDFSSAFQSHLAGTRQAISAQIAWLASRQSRSWSITSTLFDVGVLALTDGIPHLMASPTTIRVLAGLAVGQSHKSRPQPLEIKRRAALPTNVSDADVAAARARQLAWLKGGGLKELANPERRGQVWQ